MASSANQSFALLIDTDVLRRCFTANVYLTIILSPSTTKPDTLHVLRETRPTVSLRKLGAPQAANTALSVFTWRHKPCDGALLHPMAPPKAGRSAAGQIVSSVAERFEPFAALARNERAVSYIAIAEVGAGRFRARQRRQGSTQRCDLCSLVQAAMRTTQQRLR